MFRPFTASALPFLLGKPQETKPISTIVIKHQHPNGTYVQTHHHQLADLKFHICRLCTKITIQIGKEKPFAEINLPTDQLNQAHRDLHQAICQIPLVASNGTPSNWILEIWPYPHEITGHTDAPLQGKIIAKPRFQVKSASKTS